jgi:hypothetical protein
VKNGPVINLTKEEIKAMRQNEPTRRIFGTDNSLTWDQQKPWLEKLNSMLISRLNAMLQTSEVGDINEIANGIQKAQAVMMKATGQGQEETEPSEEQLARAIKK